MSFGISIGDVMKLCELAGRVYRNCRDCTGEYKSLATEARSLTNLLDDIQDKFEKIPEQKHAQLNDAYEPCVKVLQELDSLLNHYNSLDTRTKRTWDRITYDPEKVRTLRGRLTASVTMLNTFYTSMIHDSQVRILDALERLEKDYRGGHREESIASLERLTAGPAEDEAEEEAAWTQILRDLEDVGVAKQDALGYRDVIIHWLVEAVNQGRLLEQCIESDGIESISRDLLPTLDELGIPQTHYLDVPDITTPIQRSQSAPFCPPSPLSTASGPEDHRAHSIPSMTSLPVPEYYSRSSYAASYSTDTDTSSLYASPPPIPLVRPAVGSTTSQIKRVPVPNRAQAPKSSSPLPPIYTPPPASVMPPIPTRSAPPVPPVAHAISAPPTPLVPTSSIPTASHPFAASATSLPRAFPETSVPPILQTPPSYYEKNSSTTADLAWNAQQIIAAWNRRDFVSAEKLLEDQLAAVERGQTVLATGAQPDRRILRHLIGVCASYSGNFKKAKRYFESVFNGIYLNGGNLDDGDIAAARWLGDICLHLREHENCVLAWGVAHEGSIGRYGIARDRTRRVADELHQLDHWLFVFRRIESSFRNNMDPTDIFRTSHAIEKSNLITSVRTRLYEGNGYGQSATTLPMDSISRTPHNIKARPQAESMVSEGFLLGPLISLGAWPLQWDSTFSPSDAIMLDRQMNTVLTRALIPLVERTLPTTSLGESKHLDFVTRRGGTWLIEAVKKALREMGIEHSESARGPAIVCCLNQTRDGFVYSEGVEIYFKKLQFRSVHGMKVTKVNWATRMTGNMLKRDTDDFRDILKTTLARAEQESAVSELPSAALSQAPSPVYQ